MQISRKWFELQTWNQLATNRKWPTANRTMTSSMMLRDLNIIMASYLKKGSR